MPSSLLSTSPASPAIKKRRRSNGSFGYGCIKQSIDHTLNTLKARSHSDPHPDTLADSRRQPSYPEPTSPPKPKTKQQQTTSWCPENTGLSTYKALYIHSPLVSRSRRRNGSN
jgi:hypothetical protein